MAKAERALNPAAAQHKKEKASALKKSRAIVAAQRSARLATRDPARLQRQIDDLVALRDDGGGQLRPRDKQQLEQLEREVKAIRKAREDQDLPEGRQGRAAGSAGTGAGAGGKQKKTRDEGERRDNRHVNSSALGKRRRDIDEEGESSGGETDQDVRKIPMPRDTPPPKPRQPLHSRHRHHHEEEDRLRHALPERPPAPAQTTYSAAPQTRNLVKEATAAFVPAAVTARIKERKGGVGSRLLNEEDVLRLERGGYLPGTSEGMKESTEEAANGMNDELEDEEARFERELRQVQMEDDEDETDKPLGVAVEQTARTRHVQMEEVDDEDG